MGLLANANLLLRQQGSRGSGLRTSQRYRGKVVENDDRKSEDGQRNQRVKVWVSELYDHLDPKPTIADIPWTTRSSRGQASGGGGIGNVDIPPKGASVEVTLGDAGDPHIQTYHGTQSTEEGDELKEHPALKEDKWKNSYPHVKGTTMQDGSTLLVNTEEGKEEVEFRHKSGFVFNIDKEGKLSINTPGDISVGSKKTITHTADSDITNHSKSGNFSMQATAIHQNGTDTRKTTSDPITVTRPTPASAGV